MQILVDYLISLRNNALYDLNNQDNRKNKEDIYNFIKEIEKYRNSNRYTRLYKLLN